MGKKNIRLKLQFSFIWKGYDSDDYYVQSKKLMILYHFFEEAKTLQKFEIYG